MWGYKRVNLHEVCTWNVKIISEIFIIQAFKTNLEAGKAIITGNDSTITTNFFWWCQKHALILRERKGQSCRITRSKTSDVLYGLLYTVTGFRKCFPRPRLSAANSARGPGQLCHSSTVFHVNSIFMLITSVFHQTYTVFSSIMATNAHVFTGYAPGLFIWTGLKLHSCSQESGRQVSICLTSNQISLIRVTQNYSLSQGDSTTLLPSGN